MNLLFFVLLSNKYGDWCLSMHKKIRVAQHFDSAWCEKTFQSSQKSEAKVVYHIMYDWLIRNLSNFAIKAKFLNIKSYLALEYIISTILHYFRWFCFAGGINKLQSASLQLLPICGTYQRNVQQWSKRCWFYLCEAIIYIHTDVST